MVTTISYDAWVSRRHHTGTVVRSTVYDIWGSVRTTSGTVDTRLGYTGELMGAVDGTVYLRARHYRPALGRFLQRDTFAGIPTSPQSLHKYTYTHNNPIRYTDPSGHLTFIPLILAAASYVVAGFEIRLSIYDAYETGKTLLDPCASNFEKGVTVALFVGGIFMPGGGYTAGGKAAARNVDSAANYAARHVDDVDVVDDVQAIYKVTDNIDDARDANNAATTIDDADTIHVFDDLPCMPNSFVAGTLVESIDGLVPIETLTEGDLVWAVDPETGAAGWYPITWTTKHEDAELVTLSVTLLNADGEALRSTQEHTIVVTITATLEHPFWVEGAGWVDAGDLQAGDTLLSADGRRLVVQAAVRSAGPAMVYNFTVDALHTYTVTELRVVVHNTKKCQPITEVLPEDISMVRKKHFRNGTEYKGNSYFFDNMEDWEIEALLLDANNAIPIKQAHGSFIRKAQSFDGSFVGYAHDGGYFVETDWYAVIQHENGTILSMYPILPKY